MLSWRNFSRSAPRLDVEAEHFPQWTLAALNYPILSKKCGLAVMTLKIDELRILGEPCCTDVSRVLTDYPVEIEPAAETFIPVLLERSVARKRTSSENSHWSAATAPPNFSTGPKEVDGRDCLKKYIGSGVYLHFGLEKSSPRHLSRPGNIGCTGAQPQLHTEGVSPSNVSETLVWPILERTVPLLKSKPFIVGTFCRSKGIRATSAVINADKKEYVLLIDSPSPRPILRCANTTPSFVRAIWLTTL
ncbi:uncharacterized protein DEA37_0008274 [Paragonimus westermani]|uniref:Uncharacterized protein n=1 Tax=Paragonimus westermani TaxID=34504 RepID=A0A5J4NFJ1_9TREM|nr:uncharacterized protein DEA37_0008274 [Paragonimus westermani]